MKTTAKLLALLAATATSGCGHITQFSTVPEGAKVFLDGQQVCAQTPCAYDDKYGLPRRYHLQIQKPGYKEVDLYLDKQLAIWWWLGAVVLTNYASPLTSSFVYSLENGYNFVLEPVSAPPGSPPPEPPAPPGPEPDPAPPADAAPPAPPAPPAPDTGSPPPPPAPSSG